MSVEARRQLLASNHSEEEIQEIEREIQTIRERRKTSANDPEEGSIKALIKSKKSAASRGESKSSRKPGLFKRVVSRRR